MPDVPVGSKDGLRKRQPADEAVRGSADPATGFPMGSARQPLHHEVENLRDHGVQPVVLPAQDPVRRGLVENAEDALGGEPGVQSGADLSLSLTFIEDLGDELEVIP